jgi:hypothetical protein
VRKQDTTAANRAKRPGMYLMYRIWGSVLTVLVLFTACTPVEKPIDGTVTLRKEYKTLSEKEAKAMMKERGFFHRDWNKRRSFPNQFEQKNQNDEPVIIDGATGLVWHQGGSINPLSHRGALDWIAQLNRQNYAGYSNWRLPTLEEAASLLEFKRINKRYINPAFSRTQLSIRTGDMYNDVRLWSVSFHYGSLFRVGVQEPDYVRPVTSLKGGTK